MTASTIQFITKTRLAELSRQRASLLSQYDAAEAAGRETNLQGLTQLYEQLKRVRITEFPLHRDLPNLKALLQSQFAPQSLIDFWRNKLLIEIRRGRLCANVVYLFGAFLSEWDESDIQGATRIQERRLERERVLSELTTAPTPPKLEILPSLLSGYQNQHAWIEKKIFERLEQSLQLKIEGFVGLQSIAANPHFTKELRQEAKQFQSNDALARQLSDAIRVAGRDPQAWNWPEQGVHPRLLWTRHRWRLYPTLSLVDLLIVNHAAGLWSSALDDCYTSSAVLVNRRGRIQKLVDLRCPEVIMANERRMLAKAKERLLLDWYEQVDPWTTQPVLSDDESEPVMGIVSMRAGHQAALREASMLGYGYDEGVNPMIKLVHAEIELLRAAYPETPIHVLKLDIREFFGSVPHKTLLSMLQGLGMSVAGLEFTQRYLQVPYATDPKTTLNAKRGVPMEISYSHWLCETLMQLLEQFVHTRAHVRIIRQLDDICILGASADEVLAAYQAVTQFLNDVGLALNENKCGAVTIHGEKRRELPSASPRWGVLELAPSGHWQTHEDAFQAYLEDSRKEVEARHAIFAKVLAYNEQLKHLVWGLGLAMDLGDQHRLSANRALQSFEQDFFGKGNSIFKGLKDLMEERHQGELHEVPLAWMLWPITAGGLGLRSASVLCGQFQLAYDSRVKTRKDAPKEKPNDWQNQVNAWSEYYEDKFAKLEPANCDESRTMTALVEAFIRRGKTISGGEQKGLSPYWRWTLSIFGPEILERLGSFEFLLTELVPLHLIHDKLLSSDSTTSDPA